MEVFSVNSKTLFIFLVTFPYFLSNLLEVTIFFFKLKVNVFQQNWQKHIFMVNVS